MDGVAQFSPLSEGHVFSSECRIGHALVWCQKKRVNECLSRRSIRIVMNRNWQPTAMWSQVP